MQEAVISLPVTIISPTDIARLTREIEAIDNYFREQAIRSGGTPTTTMPTLSKLMDQLAADNQLNIINEADRAKVLELLESLHKSAPVMHISFSVDPPGAYVQKIVEWLRRNIHQHVLVTVGLQPNIGAGCIVRTTNRLFDFSLREFFTQKREFFIEKLHAAITDEGASASVKPASESAVETTSTPTQATVPAEASPVPVQESAQSVPVAVAGIAPAATQPVEQATNVIPVAVNGDVA